MHFGLQQAPSPIIIIREVTMRPRQVGAHPLVPVAALCRCAMT